MEIANKNRLRLLALEPNIYGGKDKIYISAAVTITTSKFGPSGSLKDRSIILESRMDVTPRAIKDMVFEIFILN